MNKHLKSKTVWTALITGAVGLSQALGYEVPDYVLTVLGAIGLYSVRDAIFKK